MFPRRLTSFLSDSLSGKKCTVDLEKLLTDVTRTVNGDSGVLQNPTDVNKFEGTGGNLVTRLLHVGDETPQQFVLLCESNTYFEETLDVDGFRVTGGGAFKYNAVLGAFGAPDVAPVAHFRGSRVSGGSASI